MLSVELGPSCGLKWMLQVYGERLMEGGTSFKDILSMLAWVRGNIVCNIDCVLAFSKARRIFDAQLEEQLRFDFIVLLKT